MAELCFKPRIWIQGCLFPDFHCSAALWEKNILKCVLSQEQSVILCLCVACRHRTGLRTTWPESLYAAQLMLLSHTFRQYVLVSSEVACNKDFNMHDSYWLLVVLNCTQVSWYQAATFVVTYKNELCSESKLYLNVNSNLLSHCLTLQT